MANVQRQLQRDAIPRTSTTDTPHSFMDTLHAFNAVSLPDALQQLTYHGVIDEDHFFTLGRTVSSRLSSIKGVLSIARNAYNLGSGDAETLLLKVNRLTGSLTQFRAIGLSTANPDATVVEYPHNIQYTHKY